MKLRRIKESDLVDMFRARNDPKVMKWCRQQSPLHWDNHVKWFEKQRADDTLEMFICEFDRKAVGVCGLTNIDWVRSIGEFSCYVFPKQQQKGHATRALSLLFDFGFKDLNLNLIWGETMAGNPAYDLFTRKMGMVHEGTRRDFYFKDGKYLDANLISLKRMEWLST